MLKVGLLKEIKNDDRRVAISPAGVKALSSKGIEIFVESSAGEGCGFSDELYIEAGATVLPSAEKLIRQAGLIVKVLPLSPVEAELINDSHIVFSFLKLNPKGDRLKPLIKSKTIYFGADLLEDDKGGHPILEAISEVAGRMAIHVGANLLSVSQGGKGILLSGVGVVPPATVTIIGSGLIGRVAAVQAWTNGANVNLLSLKPENIKSYDIIRDGLSITEFTPERLRELLPDTDILIVSVYSLRYPEADLFIDKEMINLLKPGSVIIDLSVEQSPVVETSHVTNINQPTYKANGLVHYCVPNISATVPLTSSQIYTEKIIPYIEILAKMGLENGLNKSPELLSALAMYKGKITNRILADRFDYTFYNIFDLLELNL